MEQWKALDIKLDADSEQYRSVVVPRLVHRNKQNPDEGGVCIGNGNTSRLSPFASRVKNGKTDT